MTSTVTSKGQVTLPAEARRKLGIRPGAKLQFIIRGDDRLEVIRLGGSIRDLRGILPKPKKRVSLADMDRAIAKGARRSVR